MPQQTILTPHLGELARLLKIPRPESVDHSLLSVCQHYAENKRVHFDFERGAHLYFHPDEPFKVNPTGDPGMATAGSGDVLTGLLAGLLAQGMTTQDAAALEVFIHGLAGEHAAGELTSYCMTATDILYFLPEGFRFIEI